MQKALESIRFWRGAMIKAFFDVDIHDPRKIEENGQVIGDDTLKRMLLVISNAEDGIRRLQNYIELGFTEIVLTNSSPNRDNLVKLVAEKIIPLKAKKKLLLKIAIIEVTTGCSCTCSSSGSFFSNRVYQVISIWPRIS